MDTIVKGAFAGAFASQLFAALYDRVKAIINNRSELKSMLGDLTCKLQVLEPYFSNEVLTELGFENEDEQALRDKINEGTCLLKKLSGLGCVRDMFLCESRKYRSEVQEIERFYDKLYSKIKIQELLNVKEALMLSRRMLESVLRMESRLESLGRIEGSLGSMGRMESKMQSMETKSESVNILKALDRTETTLESMNALENRVSKSVEAKSQEERMRGNAAFRNGEYALAVDAYTLAITMDPMDVRLWSNRSICLLRLGENELALQDALKCCTLEEDWPKSQYRAGQAYMKLENFEQAALHFNYCRELTQGKDKEVLEAWKEANSMLHPKPGGE